MRNKGRTSQRHHKQEVVLTRILNLNIIVDLGTEFDIFDTNKMVKRYFLR